MNILIGVSASIAIYRSCELVRELAKKGHKVRVVMTRNAQTWVSPVLFAALSENEVYTESLNQGSAMPHIDIRKDLDLFLVAPATAHLVARAALGMADDILCATLLSFDGPRWFAPSMNPYMYAHPATRQNLEKLKSYGYHILDPQNGEAVCGDEGEGKMMGIPQILAEIEGFRARKSKG